MENKKLSDVNSKSGSELIAIAHGIADNFESPVTELLRELASRLECSIIRGDRYKKERDLYHNAEMTWEKAMMAAIGEDGIGSVTKEIEKLKADKHELQQKLDAQGPFIQPHDLKALLRFNETSEDGEGYDIGAEAMSRLVELGLASDGLLKEAKVK